MKCLYNKGYIYKMILHLCFLMNEYSFIYYIRWHELLMLKKLNG